MVMGYAQVVFLPVILIIAAIAIPNLLRSRMAANEASAVGTLRTYNTALATFANQCPDYGFPSTTLKLGPGSGGCDGGANLIGAELAARHVERHGYVFFYSADKQDTQGRMIGYKIEVEPITENTTGIRHFFTDESGVIRASRGEAANEDSPPLR